MCIVVLCETKDITDVITSLDDPKYRFLFHRFRDWVFNRIGKTGLRTSGRFLQEKFSDNRPFPCDTRHSRSKDVPKSVHKLRPGRVVFESIGTIGFPLITFERLKILKRNLEYASLLKIS